MIHIGIVDPYEIMRKGLGHLIELAGGMRIVGEAGTITELLSQPDSSQIDVLVLEPIIAWGANLALVQSLISKQQRLKVLIFSESVDTGNIQAALRAGVKGFVSKRARVDELIYGIQHVAQGQSFLCAEVTAQLTLCIVNSLSKKPHELLSSREFQILLLLVNGKTVATVADELNLSAKTISTHKARIMRKMNIETFSKLIQYASAHGLISEEGQDLNR